ncbi:hypothetical protein PoB_002936400 [Plakobranchus ocellatus]|uniref:Uncharacterized protein n=1 Tax=Plakobranchus ocellatus TaxID=259542 RepID=A0AAV4A8S2_9GAST|nr:hypothetical protein PoB_002936400 [Plakobranchus ocellatus]
MDLSYCGRSSVFSNCPSRHGTLVSQVGPCFPRMRASSNRYSKLATSHFHSSCLPERGHNIILTRDDMGLSYSMKASSTCHPSQDLNHSIRASLQD